MEDRKEVKNEPREQISKEEADFNATLELIRSTFKIHRENNNKKEPPSD